MGQTSATATAFPAPTGLARTLTETCHGFIALKGTLRGALRESLGDILRQRHTLTETVLETLSLTRFMHAAAYGPRKGKTCGTREHEPLKRMGFVSPQNVAGVGLNCANG